MKTPEDIKKIKKGLKVCRKQYDGVHWISCHLDCPYKADGVWCEGVLHADALTYIQQLEERLWELFEELSTAYYGKQMYGLNDDGTVYSRYSCDTMSFEQAVDEFRRLIADE